MIDNLSKGQAHDILLYNKFRSRKARLKKALLDATNYSHVCDYATFNKALKDLEINLLKKYKLRKKARL